MNPKDFLRTAKNLCNRFPHEADFRSAVSRAYYAVFNYARERLLEEGIVYDRVDVHSSIVKELRNCGINDLPELEYLKEPIKRFEVLRRDRVRADYEMNDTTFADQKQTFLLVNRAEEIVEAFDKQNLNTYKLKLMAKGIRNYRKQILRTSR